MWAGGQACWQVGGQAGGQAGRLAGTQAGRLACGQGSTGPYCGQLPALCCCCGGGWPVGHHACCKDSACGRHRKILHAFHWRIFPPHDCELKCFFLTQIKTMYSMRRSSLIKMKIRNCSSKTFCIQWRPPDNRPPDISPPDISPPDISPPDMPTSVARITYANSVNSI